MYRQYILHWEQRADHIATSEDAPDDLRHYFHDEYDEWYRRRTHIEILHAAT
ncbi:hypothetical protein LINPERHAP2_LOCUS42990 [Linum perenne]